MFPVLTLVAAAGLLAVSTSYALTAQGVHEGEVLFWVGLILIGAPITLRLAVPDVALRERIALVLVLGLMLQLVHIVRSPNGLTNYDELLHYRSLVDILSTHHLFAPNPLLAVSPLFPGLETLTAAVAQISGADPFVAASVVLAAVRLVFSAGLFALYREASGSDRVAGLATAIYMLNPNFTFFDSAFSYETLAMPLVPVLLLLAATRARTRGAGFPFAFEAVAIAMVMTHHITTYAIAAILAAWVAVNAIVGRRGAYQTRWIAVSAGLTIAFAAAWFLSIAAVILPYLAPPISSAILEVGRLISEGQGRVPFQSATGQIAPIWERIAGLGTAALLVLSIGVGLAPLLRHHRRHSLAMLLGAIALAYPASLLARLTPTGSEAAGRSLSLVFLGLSFVAALGIVATAESVAGRVAADRGRPRPGAVHWSPFRAQQGWRLTLVGAVTVCVLGGAVIGAAPATRFPGPYLVGADSRSIDVQSTATAFWVRDTLGTNARVAADRVNRLLLGSYGHADVVFHGSRGVETWQVFLSAGVGPAEIARIREAGIDFLVIDRRLSTALPLVPFYYEEGEIFDARHSTPVSALVLGKWDGAADVARMYDSGVIQVYDVRRLGAP